MWAALVPFWADVVGVVHSNMKNAVKLKSRIALTCRPPAPHGIGNCDFPTENNFKPTRDRPTATLTVLTRRVNEIPKAA